MAAASVNNPTLASSGKVPPVILCQAAASYQATLPSALFRAGMLRRVICSVPELQILEPTAAGDLGLVKRYLLYKGFKALLWSAWGVLARRQRPPLPVVFTSWLAGRLITPWVAANSIFHGLPGLMLPALQARRGLLTSVLENATLHARGWQREVRHECAQAGIDPGRCAATLPEALIRRLEREYELCDAIVVPSTTARRSFAEFGLAHKTHVVWPGVDSEFFSPSQEPFPSSTFRACFVGRIELAKGIMYLLRAWQQLALPKAELVLVGEARPHMRSILNQYSRSNVIFTGPLQPHEVVKQYRSAHVFIHPSPSEGLGLVLLEAMACGLPVIATDRSGAEDCVTHGSDGFVIPARRVGELAEAISWCFHHRLELLTMGMAARNKAVRRFTRLRYEERQIALYRSLVGLSLAPGGRPAAFI